MKYESIKVGDVLYDCHKQRQGPTSIMGEAEAKQAIEIIPGFFPCNA